LPGGSADPVEAGFVDSLARPGGNITGLANLSWKLNGKRLELLREAFPRISRVAALWNPSHKGQARKEFLMHF
jgi:putative ABC transport system substrate-binding protein